MQPLKTQDKFINGLKEHFEVEIHTTSISGNPLSSDIIGTFDGVRLPITLLLQGECVEQAVEDTVERVRRKINNLT